MAQPLQLLFIGESGVDPVIGELQRGNYAPSFRCANNLEQLLKELPVHADIAIADLAVSPGFGALEALRVIQEQGLDLPLIVVSGKIRDAEVLAVLKAGAADHLTRGNLMRLNAAVERELSSARMRHDRVRLEEQFRQAQKMEAVGRLAGGVAHDFNNLLTVITGYSDLLLGSRDLKDTQRSALEEIRRAAERGGALTHQLLAFSRRQPMQARPLKIDELVLHMERMLRRLIGEDVELVTIAASSEDVFADPGRLEQVIMNLVVNARDAMPEGGKLTIETGSVRLGEGLAARQLGVTPGNYVTVFITDTGIGMDQETQSHLFEPFFTTKNPGRGTGPGFGDGLRHHTPKRRRHRHFERAGQRHHRAHLPAARQGEGSAPGGGEAARADAVDRRRNHPPGGGRGPRAQVDCRRTHAGAATTCWRRRAARKRCVSAKPTATKSILR